MTSQTAESTRGAIGRILGWLGIAGKRGAVMEERWRILVVDDDRDVLDLISMKLADEYDVLSVEEPTQVSQAVDLFEPDLIILDIMLPKISGYQIIEYLKRNPATAKTPVCFLSAKASARDLKYGYKMGAALYLTKPFQPDRLIRNIKLLFERTPPPRRQKRYSITEINERLKTEGLYQVATASGKATRQAPASEKPPSTPTPPATEEEGEERPRTRWVD